MSHRPQRRLLAHAVVGRAAGDVLVTPAGALPGGAVRHGEDPRDAVVRALAELALEAQVGAPAGVLQWVEDGLEHLSVGYAATVASVDEAGVSSAPGTATLRPAPDRDPGGDALDADQVPRGTVDAAGVPLRRHRIGAYALVGDGAGAVLLTELSAHTGAPGQWTLPGGGLDAGEHPVDGVVREVREETGHTVTVGPLVAVDSRHHVGDGPAGPEDYHALRLVFRAMASEVLAPQVLDVGGTTARAAWVPEADLADLPLTASTRDLLSR